MAGIQILPPKTGVLNKLGEGLQSGLEQAAEQEYKRNLSLQAINDMKGVDPNAPILEQVQHYMKAFAGRGAEQYLPVILPFLQQRQQAQILNGQASGAAMPSPGMPSHGQEQGMDPRTLQQGSQTQPPSQPGYYAGMLKSPQQIEQIANRLQQTGLDRSSAIQQASASNIIYDKEIERLKEALLGQGISKGELPYAVDFARNAPQQNPQDILKETRRAINSMRNLEKGLPSRSSIDAGFGEKSREKQIQSIRPAIKQAVEDWGDSRVREILKAETGLSATETSDEIFRSQHPKEFDSFLKTSKDLKPYSEKTAPVYKDFILKSAEKGVPLLSLRYEMFTKGMDTEEFRKNIEEAIEKGFVPNQNQKNELHELSQKMNSSFSNFWNDPAGYILGKK